MVTGSHCPGTQVHVLNEITGFQMLSGTPRRVGFCFHLVVKTSQCTKNGEKDRLQAVKNVLNTSFKSQSFSACTDSAFCFLGLKCVL